MRGLAPAPAAYTTLPDGRGLKVLRAAPVLADRLPAPGTWASDGRRYLRVATPTGWLDLLEVQLEGKKRLRTDEFLRGVQLPGVHLENQLV